RATGPGAFRPGATKMTKREEEAIESVRLREIDTIGDLIDYVEAHLVEQGCQARSEDRAVCAYRGAGGTSCAVGCLIADGHYDPAIEGSSVNGVHVAAVESSLGRKLSYVAIEVLRGLQYIHDRHLPRVWPDAFGVLREDRAAVLGDRIDHDYD